MTSSSLLVVHSLSDFIHYLGYKYYVHAFDPKFISLVPAFPLLSYMTSHSICVKPNSRSLFHISSPVFPKFSKWHPHFHSVAQDKNLITILDLSLSFTPHIQQQFLSNLPSEHILNLTTFYPPGLYHSGLVQITIFSCLNTCGSLLPGLLSFILAPLPFLLPTAAQVILSKPKTDLHAVLLKTSQWFPILLSLKPRALSLTSKP